MAAALVGSIGAASQGNSGAAVTPSWGTTENRTAGNVLACFVSVTATATLPSTPSGWYIGKQVAGTSSSATIFLKVAEGSDSAPTIAAVTGGIISAQLAEFSGAIATQIDQSGSGTASASPTTVTFGAPDKFSGSLWLAAIADYRSTPRSPNDTFTSNNATPTQAGNNNGSNSRDHYSFAYAVTTAKVNADTAAAAFSVTTNLSGASIVGLSLVPGVTYVTTLPANGVVYGTVSASATASAVIRANKTGSFTAHALVGTTKTESVSSDSIVRATQTGSLTADADVYATAGSGLFDNAFFDLDFFDAGSTETTTETVSFTANSVISVTFTGSFLSYAAKTLSQTGSVVFASTIFVSVVVGFWVSAAITRVISGSFAVNADKSAGTLSTQTGTFSITAVVLQTRIPNLSFEWPPPKLDAAVRAVKESSFDAEWVLIRYRIEDGLSANAVKLAPSSVKSFSANAKVLWKIEQTFTVDSEIIGVCFTASARIGTVVPAPDTLPFYVFKDTFSRWTGTPPVNIGFPDFGKEWNWVDWDSFGDINNTALYVNGNSLVLSPYNYQGYPFNWASISGGASITNGRVLIDVFVPDVPDGDWVTEFYWIDKDWFGGIFYASSQQQYLMGRYGYSEYYGNDRQFNIIDEGLSLVTGWNTLEFDVHIDEEFPYVQATVYPSGSRPDYPIFFSFLTEPVSVTGEYWPTEELPIFDIYYVSGSDGAVYDNIVVYDNNEILPPNMFWARADIGPRFFTANAAITRKWSFGFIQDNILFLDTFTRTTPDTGWNPGTPEIGSWAWSGYDSWTGSQSTDVIYVDGEHLVLPRQDRNYIAGSMSGPPSLDDGYFSIDFYYPSIEECDGFGTFSPYIYFYWGWLDSKWFLTVEGYKDEDFSELWLSGEGWYNAVNYASRIPYGSWVTLEAHIYLDENETRKVRATLKTKDDFDPLWTVFNATPNWIWTPYRPYAPIFDINEWDAFDPKFDNVKIWKTVSTDGPGISVDARVYSPTALDIDAVIIGVKTGGPIEIGYASVYWPNHIFLNARFAAYVPQNVVAILANADIARTFTINARIGRVGSIPVRAAVKKTHLFQTSADADIGFDYGFMRKTTTADAFIDELVRYGYFFVSADFTLRSVEVESFFLVDWVLGGEQTDAFFADADLIGQERLGSLKADAIIFGVGETWGSFTADALRRKTQSGYFFISGEVSKPYVVASAVVRGPVNGQFVLNSHIKSIIVRSNVSYDNAVVASEPIHYWTLRDILYGKSFDWFGLADGTLYRVALDAVEYSTFFNRLQSSYISYPGTFAPLGDSPRTLEFWRKSSDPNSRVAFGYGPVGEAQAFAASFNMFNGYGPITLIGQGNDAVWTSPDDEQNDGLWHHYVFTLDGTTTEVFLDGVSLGQVVLDLTPNTTASNMTAGQWADNYYMTGNLSNIALYGRVITQTEIDDHLSQGRAWVLTAFALLMAESRVIHDFTADARLSPPIGLIPVRADIALPGSSSSFTADALKVTADGAWGVIPVGAWLAGRLTIDARIGGYGSFAANAIIVTASGALGVFTADAYIKTGSIIVVPPDGTPPPIDPQRSFRVAVFIGVPTGIEYATTGSIGSGTRTQQFKRTFNWVDVSSHVVYSESSFTQRAKTGPGYFEVVLDGAFDTYTGCEIRLEIDDFIQFGGIVQQTDHTYFFEDVAKPRTVLRGTDYNVMFDQVIMYNAPYQVETDSHEGSYRPPTWWPKGVMDKKLINDLSKYAMWGTDLNVTDYVDEIASPAPVMPWTFETGQSWRSVFAMISQITTGVWFIDAYKNLHYHPRTKATANVPAITDMGGGISCSNLSVTGDISNMINDVIVWGTAARTKSSPGVAPGGVPIYAHYTADNNLMTDYYTDSIAIIQKLVDTYAAIPNRTSAQEAAYQTDLATLAYNQSQLAYYTANPTADSVAAYGFWQAAEFRDDIHIQSYVDRRAMSIIQRWGTPVLMGSCTIWEPGYGAGMVVPIVSRQHGFEANMFIREMHITFPVMATSGRGLPRYDLQFGLEPEAPWNVYDMLPTEGYDTAVAYEGASLTGGSQ